MEKDEFEHKWASHGGTSEEELPDARIPEIEGD